MESIEHAQTVLTKKELERLKRVVNNESTKDALAIAVEHTIKTYPQVK